MAKVVTRLTTQTIAYNIKKWNKKPNSLTIKIKSVQHVFQVDWKLKKKNEYLPSHAFIYYFIYFIWSLIAIAITSQELIIPNTKPTNNFIGKE